MQLEQDNRFNVTYLISASEDYAQDIAEEICYEQTVEVTPNLVDQAWIKDDILGRIEGFNQVDEGLARVIISYPGEITLFEIGHLLNVLFGNISLKNNIRIVGVSFNHGFLRHFNGPRFGVPGIRQLLGVYNQPLFGTALKPLGKTSDALADFAYQFSLGGIDIIKDDHGLTDQSFCPFRERVSACQLAIKKAEGQTKKRVLYFPHITGNPDYMIDNAIWAKEQGVGGLLYAPAMAGFDFIKKLADLTELPLMIHPGFMGSFFNDPAHGINQEVLLGTLMRLAGADLVVYPNFGGRFGFTQETCLKINSNLTERLEHIEMSWPVPSGGLKIEHIPGLINLYGQDILFLAGSSLYSRSPDLRANVQYLRQQVRLSSTNTLNSVSSRIAEVGKIYLTSSA